MLDSEDSCASDSLDSGSELDSSWLDSGAGLGLNTSCVVLQAVKSVNSVRMMIAFFMGLASVVFLYCSISWRCGQWGIGRV